MYTSLHSLALFIQCFRPKKHGIPIESFYTEHLLYSPLLVIPQSGVEGLPLLEPLPLERSLPEVRLDAASPKAWTPLNADANQ